MSKIAIGFAVLVGIFVLITVLYFVSIFAQMIFVQQISEWKISWAKAFELNDPSTKLIDITPEDSPPFLHTKDKIPLRASKRAYLTKIDREVVSTYEELNDREHESIIELRAKEHSIDWLFQKNKIYLRDGNKIGELFFSFNEVENSNLWWAYVIDKEKTLLGVSYRSKAENDLFEFNVNTKSLKLIATDIKGYTGYPSHPVQLFEPEGFEGTLVVYYTGHFLFGFGGDSVRPRKSHLMVYNKKNPNGKLLLELGYKSGLIADIEYKDGKLILKGDRSRPRQVKDHERPMKVWEVESSAW